MPTIASANTATKDEIRAVVVQNAMTASATLAPSVTAVNTALAAKADVLSAATISGNTTITTAHANRPVNVTAASLCSVDTTGMVDGDLFEFAQVGAGSLTLIGANVVAALGVDNATTNGDRTVLLCRYRASDSLLIAYFRSAVASGGGGSNAAFNATALSGAAPTDGNENLVATLTLPSNIPAGSSIRIDTLAEFGLNTGQATPGSGTWLLKLNGATIQSVPWIGATVEGIAVRTDSTVVFCTGTTAQRTSRTGGASGVTDSSVSTSAITLSGANTLTVYAQRFSGLTRPANVAVSVMTVKAGA